MRTTTKNVLVCANSNAACDELTERLVDLLHVGELFRMYAKSYNRNMLSNKIKPVCNLVEEKFKFPSLAYLYQFRVIVCTLLTAGCISRARIDSSFQSGHFSYILIDEAASVPEPTSLIPIAGTYIFGNISSNLLLI